MQRAFLLLFFFSLTGCASLLYYPVKEPFTDPSQFRHPPEEAEFSSGDGVKLHGWYFKSPIRPAKATILFFHGNAQNLSAHFSALYWMLEKGYDYMIFDYRGYGKSQGTTTIEGTVEDGQAALKWLSEHKDQATKLVIFAQSLGSAVALRVACDAAKNHGPDYAMVIVDSGFVSYQQAGRSAAAKLWLTWPLQWLPYLMFSDEYSAKNCLQDIAKVPLLVVHGTNDPTVSYHFGEELFSMAHEPKEFWKIEGGRHTDFLFREQFRYREPFTKWIEAHLASTPK